MNKEKYKYVVSKRDNGDFIIHFKQNKQFFWFKWTKWQPWSEYLEGSCAGGNFYIRFKTENEARLAAEKSGYFIRATKQDIKLNNWEMRSNPEFIF